jgi:superfamily II DNA/RNA helicase
MGLQSVSDWLISNPEFQTRLGQLTAKAAARSIGSALQISRSVEDFAPDWTYLIHCASILASSKTAQGQDAALRIAQHALSEKATREAVRVGAALVLERLANFPAINLAKKRGLISQGYEEKAPLLMQMDRVHNSLQNSIVRNDDVSFSVNKFQREVWSAAISNQWISVSAPTSAGKSFVLVEWIGEHLRERKDALVIYVVPTRALISQVFSDIREFVGAGSLSESANVSSFPHGKEVKDGQSNIFVFTQERLHLFLQSFSDASKITAVIVDEAHKVGDRYRGVLLQQMIEFVANKAKDAKFIFSSPFATNPEYLLSESPKNDKKAYFVSEVMTVNQNLIWAKQAPRKPKLWTVQLCRGDELLDLGQVELSNKPSGSRKRLAFFAAAVSGGSSGNIVYVNGAEEAEEIADLIYQLSPEIPANSDINNLIEICRKSVHEEYKLPKFLKRGIAFHYGNIPQIVRLEVERLFKLDVIKTLVCTSTLIEGVNMSCRNIFIRGPQKGRGNPMSNEDFWNLAGRAGRWGKEFQGNIFCLDPEDEDAWGAKSAPRRRKPFSMCRTTDKIFAEPKGFLDYVRLGAPRLASNDREYEYVLSYLIAIHMRVGSINIAPWASRFPTTTISEISSVIADASAKASMPIDIIERNPGISPLAMRNLYVFFSENKSSLAQFIPADPDSDDAVNSYERVFQIIHDHLLSPSLGGPVGRSLSVAILVHQWMKGRPLPFIIDKKYKNLISRSKKAAFSTVIRNTLEEVESIARFLAPKYITCYSDVIKFAAVQTGNSKLTGDVVDLGTFLEFGASQITQLSLMSLGFSRTAAIEISNRISADSLTEVECESFILTRNWINEAVPELVKREVAEFLKARSTMKKT